MKTYIGDGIYAELNEQGLVLTTENGVEITNRIVIEPREWESLNKWLSDPPPRLREKQAMETFYGGPMGDQIP